MIRLTVTAKGQVTLKQNLLKHLGVSPGEQIEADKLPDGRIVMRAAGHDGSVADFVGCLAERGGRKLTITNIDIDQNLVRKARKLMRLRSKR